MGRHFGFLIGLGVLAAATIATAGGDPKPFVKVTPTVLPAGSTVPEILMEVSAPGVMAPGARLDIYIPFLFGTPQTENPAGDNYFSAVFPKSVDARLEVIDDHPRSWILRATITAGLLKPGSKFKFSLARQHPYPFDQADLAFPTLAFGPPAAEGDAPLISKAQATVVHIPGGPPHHFRVVAPTCVTPGEAFAVKIAVLDKNNNKAGTPWSGDVSPAGAGITGPAAATLAKNAGNYLEIPGCAVASPGVYRVEVTGGGLNGVSNPIVCREGWDNRIFWGDIHGHSAFSDGMRQPDEYMDYARYVGLLDIAVLTDHAECMYENAWPESFALVDGKNDSPRFTNLIGYEWTSDAWEGGYGHRCVYLPGTGGKYYNAKVGGSNTPALLWSKYRPGDMLDIPHHTLAGFRWDDFNPAFDRDVEIVSHWGCSEYEGNPLWKGRNWRGGGVVDALNSYYLLGFVGGGDSHNGAPGQNHGPSRFDQMWYTGGITAFRVRENTRVSLWQALYDRRVYATAGNRDFIDFRVNGSPSGEIIPVGTAPRVEAEVATEGVIKAVEVVRGGETVYAVPDAAGKDHVLLNWTDDGYPGTPTYYYLRVTSADGHIAFATPVWVSAGAWAAEGESPGRPLDATPLPLPKPKGEGRTWAVYVRTSAGGPGELAVTAGGETVALGTAAPGPTVVTLPFRADGGTWDVAVAYKGPGSLEVAETAAMAYPWAEPKWRGTWWIFEGEESKYTNAPQGEDRNASGGAALRISPADNLYGQTVLWGPYEEMERGVYRIHFYLRAEGGAGSPRPVAEIAVTGFPPRTNNPPTTLAAKMLTGASLAGPDYKEFVFDITTTKSTVLEYVVKYIGTAILYIDRIEVEQVAYE